MINFIITQSPDYDVTPIREPLLIKDGREIDSSGLLTLNRIWKKA